jgi:hypothetical protein
MEGKEGCNKQKTDTQPGEKYIDDELSRRRSNENRGRCSSITALMGQGT